MHGTASTKRHDLLPDVPNVTVEKVHLGEIQKALLLKLNWVVHCDCHTLLVGLEGQRGSSRTPALAPRTQQYRVEIQAAWPWAVSGINKAIRTDFSG